ncbi:tRNA (adenosine(37)-N6)-dimethylallyltransferase MiaA, partial [bacterium]|nr:tRNA (adenosine(37)-N6)-dimethylallyltransferase MiaA [bacterium]
ARALFDGLSRAPETDPNAARELETLKTEELEKRLHRRDPESARRIHPNDRQRLLRALAVYIQTGLPLSDLHAEPVRKPLEARVIRFALMRPRDELYDRINRRSVRMFSGGLLEEVERLLEAGIPPTAPALQSIGYIQAVACLEGKIGVEQAMEDTARATRRLAKRQLTQIRSDNRFRITNLDEFSEEGACDVLARKLGTCS